MATAMASSPAAVFSTLRVRSPDTPSNKISKTLFLISNSKLSKSSASSFRIVSSQQRINATPNHLVDSILSKVMKSDGGVLLTREKHEEVAQVAQQLGTYCVDDPLKSPLIFGEWDVVYCSVPTSPGGGYRSSFGRLVFKTREMVQAVEAPDTVKNKVSFSAFGFLDGEVSLRGKLKVLDDKWIQVVFQPPQLKVAGLEFEYGGESEVKLEITYVDEKIRLGKGSTGSLFVFKRRG
eukprot:TRINITY_DN8790_c0_g1_i1.p1 TRINITY_DN8790_c0_g1~~TRINITY_DN8790_c0_g1_i1.p1  ORF type:complete len:236 (-),score=43.34 TRINITY_DN8790_c0_g1_i1:142-849(-)